MFEAELTSHRNQLAGYVLTVVLWVDVLWRGSRQFA